ncbi:MAG: type II toxin-antitoxin system VapC family toxin [Betaproteobacteria bacterium]|nr:type II toxin-antitoxin system VapC family toxin [Betaproteobacteria bacterium]
MSAATRTELLMVVHARLGAAGMEKARAFLNMHGIKTLPLDETLADLAAEAFARHGKGRHPAGLNFGDCFAFAAAKHAHAPPLCKGRDFSQTDLSPAVA